MNQPRVDTPPNLSTGSTSATIWTAVVRSLWSAVAAALLAGFTAYQTMDGTMSDEDAIKKALIVAAITFFGPFAARGGAEGAYDASRQRSGDATSADVTRNPT